MRYMATYDWSADPFAQGNVTAHGAVTAQGKVAARNAGQLCRCGCKLPHNYSVSRLVGDGETRQVLWYRHIDHRNRDTGVAR